MKTLILSSLIFLALLVGCEPVSRTSAKIEFQPVQELAPPTTECYT